MAAKEMEAAQKARRRTDYDFDSSEDDDDDDDEEEEIHLFTAARNGSDDDSSPTTWNRSTPEHPLLSPSAFDPYSPTAANTARSTTATGTLWDAPVSQSGGGADGDRDTSLFDDGSVHTVASIDDDNKASFDATTTTTTTTNHNHPTMASSSSVPGGAGYLEMEGEPPRDTFSNNESSASISTSSGLLLTHRRSSPTARRTAPVMMQQELPSRMMPLESNSNSNSNGIHTIFDKSDPHTRNTNTNGGGGFRTVQRDYFEVEHGLFGWNKPLGHEDTSSSSLHGNNSRRRHHHSMPMVQARRFLSFVRIWMVVSAAFLVLATGVLFHSFGHRNSSDMDTVSMKDGTSSSTGSGQGGAAAAAASGTQQLSGAGQIILVPMENISDPLQRQQFVAQQQQKQQQYQFPPGQLGYHTHHYQPDSTTTSQHQQHGARRVLHEIRQEFEEWVAHHRKQYRSFEEKEHRFQIWSENHER
jgi:hypothetical protein